jgi:hypothetical protein
MSLMARDVVDSDEKTSRMSTFLVLKRRLEEEAAEDGTGFGRPAMVTASKITGTANRRRRGKCKD